MSSARVLKNVIVDSYTSIVVVPESNVEPFDKTAETPELTIELARKQANEIIKQAQVTAKSIRDEAESAREQLYQASRSQGHKDGYEEGKRSAIDETKSTCDTLVANAQQIVYTANDERKNILSNSDGLLTNVVMESLRILFNREVQLERFEIEHVISDLIKYVIHGTNIEIRVHPDDYDPVVRIKPTWEDEKVGGWDLVVIADPRISIGGCKIRSDSGYVDASLEVKLEALEQKIKQYIGRMSDEGVS